jgi:small subunit ribosomal protein S20
MAHHKSAKKSIRQTIKRTARNKSIISKIRTFVRKFETLIKAKDRSGSTALFKSVQSVVMSGVTKGVLKKNTASRKVGRLAAKLKKIDL